MTQQDLERIIIGCRNGDQASFSQLIDIYGKRCFGYFYRLTGNKETSEDLLSELFVKLVEKIGSYRGGSFDGWIFTMASNIFHDHLRFKQRQTHLLDEHRRRLEFGPKVVDDRPDNDELQIALGQLDEDVRELVMLRFFSQLSFKEISQIRSEPIGTVLSKVHRGLKRLRELMGDATNYE
ncbi:MAG: RNA polymerase sigma factor [Sedimentisphaerales bacterium]|nr:RNA polymerase sigma factor [Sedimentisphaerales bacterium]